MAVTRPHAITRRALTPHELSYTISYAPKGLKTSDDIEPTSDIIGQKRAMDAIRLGLGVHSRGYNIFVTGIAGTGRSTTIKHLLEQLDHARPQLNDVCYVNNFKNQDSPLVLPFTSGEGKRFKKDMAYLVESLRKVVPKIFLSEDYKDRYSRIVREFENRQKELISQFEEKLAKAGFVMVQVQSSLGVRNEIQPLVENEPNSLEKLEKLARDGKFSVAQLDEFRRRWDSLRREFDVTTVESKKLNNKLDDALDRLNSSMVVPLIADKINLLKRRYPYEKIIRYLEDAQEALSGDLDRFREAGPRRGEEEAPSFRKREPFEEFSVNLVLDNSESTGVPIIIEKSPSYRNLFGSVERVVDRFGYWRTDFTRITAGSLLKAAGGFLVINALDLLSEPGVWAPLKRALRNGEMEIASYDPFYMMAGSGIKPEAIPLKVKVVLIGDAYIYRLLWQLDEDFKMVFKVKAEFDTTMDLTDRNVLLFYRFIKRIILEDNLLPYDLSGMQAIVEFARRLANHRKKLTVRFTNVADMIREAEICARERGATHVAREDVHAASQKKRKRVNLVEDKIQELIDYNTLMVSVTGEVVGQINGLSVYNVGEYLFGRPTRITVNTSLGKSGVINIEREADLSGPVHDKGVLVLSGWLRETFAQDKPLQMSASISFEQSYNGVDGDSASSTEIYGILSSLTNTPIRQYIGVTGSVNQKGCIQPIGGVNEKIEGFFDVCKARGLSGKQGVVIPHQNVQDLLLRPDVMDAIKAGKFHIWPVKYITEGMEIVMGKPAGKRLANGKFTPGSLLARADEKLRQMALDIDRFGREEKKEANSKAKPKLAIAAKSRAHKRPKRGRIVKK